MSELVGQIGDFWLSQRSGSEQGRRGVNGFCLSPADVAELTGAERRAGQLEWLAQAGIPAVMGRDGKVKVLRAAVEAKMMPSNSRMHSRTEPNLSALKKAS